MNNNLPISMNRTILLFTLALISVVSSAETIKVEGIYYRVSDKRCVEVVNSPTKYWGDITIPETIRFNGITYKVMGIGENAFYECTDIKSISLPNSITYIRKQAFRDCKNLKSISLPNNIAIIEEKAFLDCDNISSLKLPNGLRQIREEAFYGCKKIESLTFPESLAVIEKNAFFNCVTIKSLFIPQNVQQIGYGAFSECSSLREISVDSLNTKYDSRNDCNAIIESNTNTLITGCLNTIIPNNIVAIGQSAFAGCSGLLSVNIPNSVKFIEKGAFTWSGLKSIDLPNSVEQIGEFAFQSCKSMITVTIPESVILIDEVAFSGCDSLKSVTIYGNEVDLCKWAFASCPKLTEVYLYSFFPLSVGEDVFDDCSDNAVLHVQPSMVESYKNDNKWKYTFKNIVAIGSEENSNTNKILVWTIVGLLLLFFLFKAFLRKMK